MQSVSDDDVRKRLLKKPRFELAVKGVFRLERRLLVTQQLCFWLTFICLYRYLISQSVWNWIWPIRLITYNSESVIFISAFLRFTVLRLRLNCEFRTFCLSSYTISSAFPFFYVYDTCRPTFLLWIRDTRDTQSGNSCCVKYSVADSGRGRVSHAVKNPSHSR